MAELSFWSGRRRWNHVSDPLHWSQREMEGARTQSRVRQGDSGPQDDDLREMANQRQPKNSATAK